MKLKDAMRLHNEDEVIIKKTGQVLRVIETRLHPKVFYLLLSDGNWYNNKEIK